MVYSKHNTSFPILHYAVPGIVALQSLPTHTASPDITLGPIAPPPEQDVFTVLLQKEPEQKVRRTDRWGSHRDRPACYTHMYGHLLELNGSQGTLDVSGTRIWIHPTTLISAVVPRIRGQGLGGRG